MKNIYISEFSLNLNFHKFKARKSAFLLAYSLSFINLQKSDFIQKGKSESEIRKNQERFKDIKKSYEVLSDTKLRREYDEQLENEKARLEYEQRLQENIIKAERVNKLNAQKKEQERYLKKLNERRNKARRLRAQNNPQTTQSETAFPNPNYSNPIQPNLASMPNFDEAVNEAFSSFGVISNNQNFSTSFNYGFSQVYADELFREFFS